MGCWQKEANSPWWRSAEVKDFLHMELGQGDQPPTPRASGRHSPCWAWGSTSRRPLHPHHRDPCHMPLTPIKGCLTAGHLAPDTGSHAPCHQPPAPSAVCYVASSCHSSADVPHHSELCSQLASTAASRHHHKKNGLDLSMGRKKGMAWRSSPPPSL